MAGQMQNSPISLRGSVLRVQYESNDGMYAVLRVRTADGREITVRGALGGIAPGQELELEGVWEEHAEFGRQFKVVSSKSLLPSTADGIRRFLASGVAAGIGPKLAGMIVDHFGEQTLTILNHSSRRLIEVPGIGRKKAAAIAEGWKSSAARRDDMIFLQGLGITSGCCSRLFARYGDAAAQMVRSNPYRLAEEVDGIGFLKADEIAAALGVARDSIHRLAAAAIYCMNNAVSAGHVCVPPETLSTQAAELAKVAAEQAMEGIKSAVERGFLVYDSNMLYTPVLAAAERELPRLLRGLLQCRTFAGRRLAGHAAGSGRRGGPTLNREQLGAVELIASRPLTIITGGPGVGKTTVVGEIVARCRAAGLKLMLGAPTGRAAKRLNEATGHEAATIHRMLGYDPGVGRFTRNESAPLEAEILIIDESSMLDIVLAHALFKAIKPGCSVVLVGDADQLPSVGPGTVLPDFINSGLFGVSHLVEIYRQMRDSAIVVNAHRVNAGCLPELPASPVSGTADFYWIEQDEPARVLEIIEKLVVERIPARFGFSPGRGEIQVLTPMNRGLCGAVSINTALEARLNSDPHRDSLRCGERVFKCGDRVIQISNDYDKNVFNGDMGVLYSINPARKRFTVVFDGVRSVEYAADEIDQLLPAYAITVHKSQGSEFPVVVVPFLTQHYMMLQRNLLYTAMTRAKKLLVLIGSRRAIQMAVRNVRTEPRISRLGERLAALRRGDS